MFIKRNYSDPFFTVKRRPRRNWSGVLFFLGLMIGLGLLFALTNFDRLQTAAIDLMGMAPTPTPFPSELATDAENLIVAGDLEAAVALYAQVIAQRPNDVDYLYEYGRLMIDQGDYEGALAMAERSLTASPNDPRGFALQAEALTLSGNPSAAIPIALSGIEIDETFAPLYAVLARAYGDTGRLQDALDAGFQAVQLDSMDAEARRAYAYVLNLSNLRDDATAELERAVAIDPNRIPAYFELAYQYLASNRDQEAIDLYSRILSLQPQNVRAMLRLCGAYRKVGQFERALGFCEDAAAADPNSSAAHYEVGRLRYNARNFSGALEAFEACYRLESSSVECSYYRGLAQYYLGDCDTAWSILRESLAMARARSGTEGAVEDIRAGLVAIEQTCPGYGGQVGTLTDPTPADGGS